ncbi:hypothetical protein FGO68_gene13817 [Halteria grandinella]|uniref:Uncharacterized protein n=1 Tax=Halteria grandinella TaxID=5974 RepID=A0A8J8T828_HALGN|nr:hypothetical protein FGO68_gene13817 [Halteria grandinella]
MEIKRNPHSHMTLKESGSNNSKADIHTQTNHKGESMARIRMMNSGHQMSSTDRGETLRSASVRGETRVTTKAGTRVQVAADFTVDRITTISGGRTISMTNSIGSMKRNSSGSRKNSLGNKKRRMREHRMQIASQMSKQTKQ